MPFSLVDKLVGLASTAPHARKVARISTEEHIRRSSTGFWHWLYLKHWKLSDFNHRLRMLLVASLTLVSVYVLAPTVSYYLQSQEQRDKMFSSKRQDKYTTGLINTRNDCFANSSIQAFASLPGLNDYLNDIIKQHKLLLGLPIKPKEDDKLPQIPLHEAMAHIVSQLQEPISKERHISVWPFLQVIEKIFNSKISTNQNDAHELVQLILETLDNESIKFKKYVKKNSLNFVIPDLPFNGLLADQLTCTTCLNSSKPSFHPFSVLSLPVPEAQTFSLAEMVKNSEVETINGYNCLRCKIQAILKAGEYKATAGVNISQNESFLVSQLKVQEQNLYINDDLSKELEEFIKDYEYAGFKAKELQSTIVKKTLVVKAPTLLTVHLSRSVFTGTFITRNSCRVEFEEILNIDIDDNLALVYEEKLKAARKAKKKINNGIATPGAPSLNSLNINGVGVGEEEQEGNGNEEEDDDDGDDPAIDGYEDDRLEPEQLKRVHSKVLTSHVEQTGTDEFVEQAEHPETSPSTDVDDDSDKIHSTSTGVTSFEVPGDSDDESIRSAGSYNSQEDNGSEELNISKENVKYKLRAVIRHQGTHNAGHYECFRHKPLMVKDTLTDRVVDLSLKIDIEESILDENEPQPPSRAATPDITVNGTTSTGNTATASRGSKKDVSPSNYESVSRNSEAADDDGASGSGGFSRFRSRLGSIVSRRSSISHTGSSPRRNSIHGTPLTSLNESSVENIIPDFKSFSFNVDGKPRDKRYKKISSVNRYPYWRISDTRVSEARTKDVLSERAGVYMIYYQKI